MTIQGSIACSTRATYEYAANLPVRTGQVVRHEAYASQQVRLPAPACRSGDDKIPLVEKRETNVRCLDLADALTSP